MAQANLSRGGSKNFQRRMRMEKIKSKGGAVGAAASPLDPSLNLSNLPVELLHRIFHYCDARTIRCAMRFVCKRLRNIVNQYDQVELVLNCKDQMYYKRFLCSIPPHIVSSLIVSFEGVHIPEYGGHEVVPCTHLFHHIRHLSLRSMTNGSLQLFLRDANYLQLVSLTIESRDQLDRETCSRISSMIGRLNLQKLCLPKLDYDIAATMWSKQCQLTHLTLGSCRYSQYPTLLQQSPHLKTLKLNDMIGCNEEMPIGPITSQLTCLIIKIRMLSTQQLKSVLSKTPTIRELQIGFHTKSLSSLADIYDWENFARTELNFLDRFRYLIPYRFTCNDAINFDSLMIPFQGPFWLNEKHWFVAYEYIFDGSSSVLLHAVPNTNDFCDFHNRKYGILFQQNNFYLTKREKPNLISIVPCDVSSQILTKYNI